MKNTGKRPHSVWTRLLSALMAVVMSTCLLSAAVVPASAASWMEPYLEKLVSWGIMRGDPSGDLRPNQDITRAEFVVLVNRAFGYDKTGPVPFRDVNPSDWYYDDICIGYNAGYFKGTTNTTASPRNPVTREQATVLLGRNLVLDDDPGASMDFSDSNNLATWSRGIVRSAVAEKIVGGYTDGTFRPKQNITRGEMAALLVKAIGTPVSEPGTYSLGGIYGNVTVSSSGVTLKDTTIAGNLYITGGLGLGSVNLENVTVMGKIVVSGAGESNKGENSIQLRNVTAPNLIMDSLANQFVTVRADGDTKIDNASIRTSAYLEDATDGSHGFTKIELDGESGSSLDLAGNIKEVINLTPQSTVRVTKGTTKVLTVDEAAFNSAVDVARNAVTGTLNLDVGTKVTGVGDVTSLNINAAGSSATLLPDKVTVRPGLDANVGGEKMDTTLAAEFSADPRLLSGYPKITNLNPTSATAVFRTNKSGTLYWVLTSITDGSVNEDVLLNPASRANIVKSGSIKVTSSNTDFNAALTGLTPDGSYYVSAMLVDARGQRSPVKVVSFSTPDNTTPNFASGYPYLSKITNNAAQVAVMPNKTCRLYYALLPKGATAPTAKDFRANAVPGNYGFGTLDVTKNEARLFYVNNKQLTELANYDLYLWLTDEDGSHSSSVKKLSFTTVDKTPPEFVTEPTVTSIKETSVTLTASINEVGTIFWVAVKEGDEYPKPINGQAVKPALTSDAAKLQVVNGMNALKSGKVTAAANKDVTINISGLTSEGAYDVYYLIQDKAGNYSVRVEKITVHTLDTNAPTISQEFTRTNDSEGKSPLADTDVRIIFSENVQDTQSGKQLLALYQTSQDTTKSQADRDNAKNELASILRRDIVLYDASVTPAVPVKDKINCSTAGESWTINYEGAVVTAEDGKVIVTFKNGDNINLESGGKYYFQVQDIADTSTNKNIIKPNPTDLEPFTTVFAQLNITNSVASATVGSAEIPFDMSFKIVPSATGSVNENVYWDLLFRTSSTVSFKLYEKIGDGAWEEVTDKTASTLSTDGSIMGASYSQNFKDSTNAKTDFEPLKNVSETRQYGLVFTSYNGNTERATWNGRVEMEVRAVAGSNYSEMRNLAIGNIRNTDLDAAFASGIVEVGSPTDYTMKTVFTDSLPPQFQIGFPQFDKSDVTTVMNLQLDRSSGTIYYVVAPVTVIRTVLDDATVIGNDNWLSSLPETTDSVNGWTFCSTPTRLTVMKPNFSDSRIKTGRVSYYGATVPVSLSDLEPETKYVAYFVLQGDSQNVYTENPYVFRFETTEVSRPIITLDISNPSVNVSVNSTSNVDYLLAVNGREPTKLRDSMANTSYLDTSKITVAEFETKYRSGYTVLDAMSQDYYEGGELKGSVFDHYASQSTKETFANYIRSQVPSEGSVTMKGTVTVSAGRTVSVNCSSGMSGTTWYTFLTVGKSDSGSGDAFRAIRPVFNTDNEAPVITSCNYYLTSDAPTSANGTCSGKLTLQFNEDLYWKTQDGVDQTIKALQDISIAADSDKMAAGLAFETPSNNFKYTNSSNTSAKTMSTVTFTFTNARAGQYITCKTNLSDQSGNVHRSPLSVTLKYQANSDGTYAPYFTITPEWDATSN